MQTTPTIAAMKVQAVGNKLTIGAGHWPLGVMDEPDTAAAIAADLNAYRAPKPITDPEVLALAYAELRYGVALDAFTVARATLPRPETAPYADALNMAGYLNRAAEDLYAAAVADLIAGA